MTKFVQYGKGNPPINMEHIITFKHCRDNLKFIEFYTADRKCINWEFSGPSEAKLVYESLLKDFT